MKKRRTQGGNAVVTKVENEDGMQLFSLFHVRRLIISLLWLRYRADATRVKAKCCQGGWYFSLLISFAFFLISVFSRQ